MIIKQSDFENGGEVDFTAHYEKDGKKGRLSVRRTALGEYELYVHFFLNKTDEVLYTGTLKDCVKKAGMGDIVDE